MTKLNDIYVCNLCGNRVEVVHEGAGELVCCGQPMQRKAAGTSDGAAEKHVPAVQKVEGGYQVTVGSVEHPMTPEHHIEWIELICPKCNKVQRKYLQPTDKPQAFFACDAEHVIVREYCNLHGLWEKEI